MEQIKNIQNDGRVFIDMPNDPKNPCLSCGVCCVHFRVSFYHGEIDTQPMGFVPQQYTTKINDFFACMKGTEKGYSKCIALSGTPGRPGISCIIYNNRPSPCREFPVWMEDGSINPKCNELRAKIGLKPL